MSVILNLKYVYECCLLTKMNFNDDLEIRTFVKLFWFARYVLTIQYKTYGTAEFQYMYFKYLSKIT